MILGDVDWIEVQDCAIGMMQLPNECVDLTVTSPPYDNMRTYNGFTFDFESIAKQLYRITKDGGVVVWIVADETVNGSETGTSFRQALYFQEIGFRIHDTMIWNKGAFTATGSLTVRYASVFEYMFVFSKGKPKVFNPIKDRKTKNYGRKISGTVRNKDGTMKAMSNIGKPYNEYGHRFNVWDIPDDKEVQWNHPAKFPVKLVRDHIISWSNRGDVVLDCFMGSGTTAIASIQTGRHFIGYEISQEYYDMSMKRIEKEKMQGIQMDLFMSKGGDLE